MPNSESPKLYDPLLILTGNRGSIMRLADSPHTLLLGAILIITAGLARNYDHLYLLKEWQWLYGLYIASVLSSLIIFFVGCRKHIRQQSKYPYLTFLSLYWITAPCAWLYAIPIESFTDIVTATKWNIAFLAIVSIWRVLLVARYLSVMSGEKFGHSFIRITWTAATIMCVASFFKGIELVGIMGGVELSDHEEILKSAANFTTVFCFFVATIGLITHLILRTNDEGTHLKPLPWKSIQTTTAPKQLYLITSVLVILSIVSVSLSSIQKQTKNNHTLTTLLRADEETKAIEFVSNLTREDFLEHHEVPPGRASYRFAFSRSNYSLLSHTNAETPEWIIQKWLEYAKSNRYLTFTEREVNKELDAYFSKEALNPQDYSPHHQRIRELLFNSFICRPETPEELAAEEEAQEKEDTNLFY